MTGTANCFTPTFVAEIRPPKRSFVASGFCSGTKIANEVLRARSRNPNLSWDLGAISETNLWNCPKLSPPPLPGSNFMTHASFAERLDKVRREDLLLFLNAGLTATGQGGFYHGPERLSLTFLHSYMAENYRELNASMLAAGLSDHNLAHSLYTLLSSGAPEEPEARRKENALIEMAVRRLPPQRAYRLFERLANGKVNNRRARATVRGYLKWRKSLFLTP